MEKIQKTEAQWRACLPEAVYRVCREKGTEPPFLAPFWRTRQRVFTNVAPVERRYFHQRISLIRARGGQVSGRLWPPLR